MDVYGFNKMVSLFYFFWVFIIIFKRIIEFYRDMWLSLVVVNVGLFILGVYRKENVKCIICR